MPADIRLALTPLEPAASNATQAASLFASSDLSPDEKRVYSVLRADEPTHIDELVERLVAELSSAQIFASIFELELSSRICTMPGKYYVPVI